MVMAKTIIIDDNCSWVIGIKEYLIYNNVKYKMIYSNNSNFKVSDKVPKEIVIKIKNILKGDLFNVL